MKNIFLFFAFSLLITADKTFGQTIPTTLWSDIASTQWYDGQNTTFTITTAEDLAGLSVLVANGNDFSGKTILIGDNINLESNLWTPIGIDQNLPFSGLVDGNGFSISNLYIDAVD